MTINEIIAKLDKAGIKGIAVQEENISDLLNHPNADWEEDDNPAFIIGKHIVIDGDWVLNIGTENYRVRCIINPEPDTKPGAWNLSMVHTETCIWASVPFFTAMPKDN